MRQANESGFTIIEILVTVIVSLIFLLSAFNLAGTISQLSISSSQFTTADNLAYSNLRLYANSRPPTWFPCEQTTVPTDLVKPSGWTDKTSAVTNLPPPVTQTVRASAPFGCGAGSGAGLPIRVESIVTYGSTNRSINHASYTSY